MAIFEISDGMAATCMLADEKNNYSYFMDLMTLRVLTLSGRPGQNVVDELRCAAENQVRYYISIWMFRLPLRLIGGENCL